MSEHTRRDLVRLHLTVLPARPAHGRVDAEPSSAPRSTWLPFDLHPEYPPEGIPRAELHRALRLERRCTTAARAVRAGGPRVQPAARRRPEHAPRAAAHRARARARAARAMHDRLMDAYWAEASNIGDADELRRLAAEVGLDDPDTALRRRGYSSACSRRRRRRTRSARPACRPSSSTGGCSCSGAQPREVFEQAFGRLERMKRLTAIPGVVLIAVAAAMWGTDPIIRKPLAHDDDGDDDRLRRARRARRC